ncbi:hypothetical protein [Herbaspirillum sp. meg3]|nr:hypothetical protein [Herbaspirillum sp. meg3]
MRRLCLFVGGIALLFSLGGCVCAPWLCGPGPGGGGPRGGGEGPGPR